jgi:hypothetical protein
MSTEYSILQQHNIHFYQQSLDLSLKTDYILGHKASFSKYKKIEIIPCMLPDHNALNLELNNKSSSRKYQTTES